MNFSLINDIANLNIWLGLRSFKKQILRFTTRTDDSHAIPQGYKHLVGYIMYCFLSIGKIFRGLSN